MTMERDERVQDREKERQRDRGREKERDKEREKVKLKEKERDLEKKERGNKDLDKERAHDKERDRERGGKDKERGGKDLEKEKDRERGKDQERERDRKKEREKDKKRDHSKKDKDREREKEREKEKDRERGKEKERDREKVTEKEKDKERIGERETDNDREKERERDAREKEREREREREVREKEKEREREVREKEREREVREKEREREVREKEREREREVREKERERERENVREREKENERDDKDHQKLRPREKERDNREKERDNRERERDHDRDYNKHKDWTERDRDRETVKEHEAEKEGKEKKRDEKDRPIRESHGSRASASELEDRIAKMREERHRASAEQRASAKRPDDDSDINAWVNKSRKIEQRKKLDDRQKAARMAKLLADQDNEEDEDDSGDEFNSSGYGGKDLAGLKVRHGFDKVMEGHAVVLTLKDTSVLDGDDVNLAGDELENIEMAQQEAREDAYKAAKKKPGSYEDKFGNDMDALVTKRTILPQYDDVVKDEGVILDASGGLSEESKKKLEEVRLRLESSAAKSSLNGSVTQPVSDYFTQEDMLQFKKPKKKKKLRKKDKIDIDELEAEAVAAGLGAEDLGSRNPEGRRAQQQAEEKALADARKKAYQNALNKAEDASKALRNENAAEPMEVEKGAESPVYVGDDDDDFYKSLDRARQAALKNQRNSGNSGGGAQSVVARLAALQQEAVSSSKTSTGGGDAQDGGLVFTDTGEFCRSLQLDYAIIRRAGPKEMFAEEEEEAPVEEMEVDTANAAAGGWTEIVEDDKKNTVGEEETDRGDPEEEPIVEVAVGRGLAGALSLLQERGTLKETVDWGGRNMDKKRSKLVGIVDESNNQVGQRDILLDRVDEFGRTMTPKEAFRKLSHKFHGKGPGKMKQEKKMKQFQEELRLKQMNSGDTPLMSMEKMREAQARMHTPYIVISGHIKPGQTSDPRSGFATVEKEPIGSLTPMLGDKSAGSLTPMLGDKKVEHFLGIKRKSDSGFKEPAPKQPRI